MKNADIPAMPQYGKFDDQSKGLTKREYLAAMAMQGILACGPHDCDERGIAHDAIRQADALLIKLEKTQ